MLKKEFWKYFFNTYKNAKWLILRYLIVAVYLTVSSVIANKMELVNLTYFNAIIGIAYFSEIIGFGISNGIGIYINQNIKNKNKVDYYIKIGGYINCFCSLVLVIILACCYYPILHLLLGLPKNINYTFYFIMLIYMFLMSNLAYFMNILKELKLFFSEMIVSIIQSILIVGGFLLIWFSFNLVLYLIAIIYIFTTLCALIFCFVYFYKNKHVQIQLFKFVKIKFIKNEFMVYWRSFMSQFVWQIGYIMLSYFILRVSEVVFNQYSYFENVLDIFNGFLFSFITITSIDICRKLGEGDFDESYKIGKYSLYSSFIIWLFYALCSLSFSSLIIKGMSDEIKDLAFISLVLYVILHLFRFLSWNLFSYILCWGGKVKLIMWQEIIATLYYVAFYFLAPFLINNIYLIYSIILVPVLIQAILGLIVFKRKKWMEKLSIGNEEN